MKEIVKVKWKTISVPEGLYERIKNLSEREQRTIWQVLDQAVSNYEILKRKPLEKQSLPKIEKLSWYVTKLALSVTWYALTKDDEHYWESLKTVDEVQKRLNVNLQSLVDILTIMKSKKTRMKKKINASVYQALKRSIVEIISDADTS
jgi:hypothetical protein